MIYKAITVTNQLVLLQVIKNNHPIVIMITNNKINFRVNSIKNMSISLFMIKLIAL